MNPAMLALLAARAAAPTGGDWTPADIPGLIGWYDATDTATITQTGGRVTGWADKSGNNRHAAFTGTEAGLPTLGTLNGTQALTWGGTAGQNTGSVNLPLAGDTTVAIVWQWEATGHRSAAYGGALTHPEMLQDAAGSNVWRVQASRTVTLGAGGAPHCTRTYMRESTDGTVFHDGTSLSTGGAFPLTGTSITSIGRAERAAIYLKGSIGELVVAAGNAPKLDAYLQQKWGLAFYQYVTMNYADTVTRSRTFSDVSLGAAAANRTIIIAAHSRGIGGPPATALTVAGVTATKHVELIDGVVSTQIWTAVVPTGTTGDISLTYGAVSETQRVEVWAAYGTLAYSTSGTSGVAGLSVTLTAPANCLSIAAQTSTAGAGYGTAYVGLTEDFRSPSTDYMTCAAASGRPSAGSHTVTVPGSSGSNSAAVVVDFTLT